MPTIVSTECQPQLDILKQAIGSAAAAWEVELSPGRGYYVIDPSRPNANDPERAHEPLGGGSTRSLRSFCDVLATATDAVRLARESDGWDGLCPDCADRADAGRAESDG